VQPIYPAAAKADGTEATVILHAIIGKDGAPLSLRVVNSEANPELARAAVDAVSKWRYSATLLNGEPVEVDTTHKCQFQTVALIGLLNGRSDDRGRFVSNSEGNRKAPD
jgi:TonB family protein